MGIVFGIHHYDPLCQWKRQLVSRIIDYFRAVRAFLDPELQAGTITQQQGLNILLVDVVFFSCFCATGS